MKTNEKSFKIRKKNFMIKGPNFEHFKKSCIINKTKNLFNYYKYSQTFNNNNWNNYNSDSNINNNNKEFNLNFYLKEVIDKKLDINILNKKNENSKSINSNLEDENNKFKTILKMWKIFINNIDCKEKEKIDILHLIYDNLTNINQDLIKLINDMNEEKNKKLKELETVKEKLYFKDERDEFIKSIKLFLKLYQFNSLQKLNRKYQNNDEFLEYKNSYLLMKNSNLRNILENLEKLIENFCLNNESLLQDNNLLEKQNNELKNIIEEWKNKLEKNFKNYNEIIKEVKDNHNKQIREILENNEEIYISKIKLLETNNIKLQKEKDNLNEKIKNNEDYIKILEIENKKKKWKMKNVDIQVNIKKKIINNPKNNLKNIINNANAYKFFGEIKNKNWLISITNLILMKKLLYDINYDLYNNELIDLKNCIAIFFTTEFGSFSSAKINLIDFITTLSNFSGNGFNNKLICYNLMLNKKNSNNYLTKKLYSHDYFFRLYLKILLVIKIFSFNNTCPMYEYDNITFIKEEDSIFLYFIINNLLYNMMNDKNLERDYLDNIELIEKKIFDIINENNYILINKKNINPDYIKGKISVEFFIKKIIENYFNYKEGCLNKILKDFEFCNRSTNGDFLYNDFVTNIKQEFPNQSDYWYDNLFYILSKKYFSRDNNNQKLNIVFDKLYKYLLKDNDNINYFYIFLTYYLENKNEHDLNINSRKKSIFSDKNYIYNKKHMINVIKNIHNVVKNLFEKIEKINSKKINKEIIEKYIHDLFSKYIFIDESIKDLEEKGIKFKNNDVLENLKKQFKYQKLFFQKKFNNDPNHNKEYYNYKEFIKLKSNIIELSENFKKMIYIVYQNN